MLPTNAADDDDDEQVLGVAEYYAAILNPPCIMRMYRQLLFTQTALLLEASSVYDKKRQRGTPRTPSVFEQRLAWDDFCGRHGEKNHFKKHLRMTKASFDKLLSYIQHDLEVDNEKARSRGGAILPELCLYCCLRYCAGGSYSDIMYFTGISTSSFYRIVWKCIDAIINCTLLSIDFPTKTEEVIEAAKGFTTISSQGCIWNCVAVIDGYHLQMRTPSKKEVKNVKSFFSGHYRTHGVNIQAACDHSCCFVFIGVAGPGVMGDRDAVNQIRLGSLIESLPGLYCVIGDCAYTPSEHLVPIFRGESAKTARNDNFNFFASQLRIRIEMAFGLMVKKWGILSGPLEIKICHIKRLIVAIGRLHNFCINERLLLAEEEEARRRSRRGNANMTQVGQAATFTPTNAEFDCHNI